MADRPELSQAAQRVLVLEPTTIDRVGGLMELVGDLFHCMTGPPRAYFELPTAPVDHSTYFCLVPSCPGFHETVQGLCGTGESDINVVDHWKHARLNPGFIR